MTGDEEIKTQVEVNLDVIDKIINYIDEWTVTNQTVDIGVIGMSGCGKSTFINTVRNLKPLDPGAAKVGVKETTVEKKKYPHPSNKNLIFWDLPGVGTKTFPREKYKTLIDFPKYDFFLLLSSSKFLEDEAWLNDEIIQSGRKHFFVRTKIDVDVANAKKDMAGTEHETLYEIRKDLERNLDDNGIPGPQIFLIDCHDPQAYDFDALTNCLVANASSLQKEVLALTLFSWTNYELLTEKMEFLRKRINIVAAKAALAVTTPIAGKPMSSSILAKEANFYQEQFKLDAKSLRKLAEKMGISYAEFAAKIALKTQEMPFTPMDMAALVGTIPFRTLSFSANIAKTTIAAALEFFRYKDFLSKALGEAFDDACKIHSAFMKRTSKL